MADAIRDTIKASIKDINIRNAYLDYANLGELAKVGIKAATDSGFKGGFGGFWSTLYDQLTTPIKTVGGQTLYRVGNKLEFWADPGIKTVGQYLEISGFNPTALIIPNIKPTSE